MAIVQIKITRLISSLRQRKQKIRKSENPSFRDPYYKKGYVSYCLHQTFMSYLQWHFLWHWQFLWHWNLIIWYFRLNMTKDLKKICFRNNDAAWINCLATGIIGEERWHQTGRWMFSVLKLKKYYIWSFPLINACESLSSVYGQEMASLLSIPFTTTKRTEVSKKYMRCCWKPYHLS